MKTVREAMSAGVRTIYCNSGLIINISDVYGNEWETMSYVKNIDGKPVPRWIFCTLGSMYKNRDALNYIGVDDLIKAKRHISYHDFSVRERELNLLIALNKGIDEYQTMYWVNGWIDEWR